MLPLPASVVCYSLCPFLGPSDILNLRVTNSRLLEVLHDEAESEEMWKMMLIRDFGFQKDAKTDDWWKQTLKVEFPIPSCTSVFGVDPGMESPLRDAKSAFDAWKGWVRASRRFFEDLPNGEDAKQLIHGPYFLRAARMWEQIYSWCNHSPSFGHNPSLGTMIKRSFQRGLRFKDWDSRFRYEIGLQAAQAIYAYCGGQQVAMYSIEGFDGLFGGYQAYNYYCNSHLVPPGKPLGDNTHMVVSQCIFSNMNRMPKIFAVNMGSGILSLLTPSQPKTRAIRDGCASPQEEFLVWMEEFTHRLTARTIGAGIMGCTPHDPASITLYPRWTNPPPVSSPEQSVPYCSYAVTRGVEVIASAIYAPQAVESFGYIYSIRIRLITPTSRALRTGDHTDSSNYMSPSERGFETCQLNTRNWQISNFETGNTDSVHGEGVIGMFPLLREGGYTDDGHSFDGAFQYQSCSGPIKKGSFGGSLTFVPGSINQPTGPPFEVELKPFLLDNDPAILY
mmetsp:Transcript_18351/g.45477  ORF Transcript_18351/g.45477 Transcript_18351/m.45477 type:complete len:505 (-) Transcript_18351:95-1609(-)